MEEIRAFSAGSNPAIPQKDDIDYTSLLIFAIETEETNGKQERYVHYYGFTYLNEGNENPIYELVEYTYFYIPLSEVLENGIFKTEDTYGELFNQYMNDYNRLDELKAACDSYDNGLPPTYIDNKSITGELPDGIYMTSYAEEYR